MPLRVITVLKHFLSTVFDKITCIHTTLKGDASESGTKGWKDLGRLWRVSRKGIMERERKSIYSKLIRDKGISLSIGKKKYIYI